MAWGPLSKKAVGHSCMAVPGGTGYQNQARRAACVAADTWVKLSPKGALPSPKGVIMAFSFSLAKTTVSHVPGDTENRLAHRCLGRQLPGGRNPDGPCGRPDRPGAGQPMGRRCGDGAAASRAAGGDGCGAGDGDRRGALSAAGAAIVGAAGREQLSGGGACGRCAAG